MGKMPGGNVIWRDLGPLNHPRFSEVKGHTATLIGDKVYVIGGRDRLCTFQVLHTDTMQWKVLPDNAPQRRYHSANLVDERLFIFYGFEANHHADHAVAVYDAGKTCGLVMIVHSYCICIRKRWVLSMCCMCYMYDICIYMNACCICVIGVVDRCMTCGSVTFEMCE